MTEYRYDLRRVLVPLHYDIARKIADMAVWSRSARLAVGPRVLAALLAEIDDSHRQVHNLVDALATSGDGMLACHRERNAAQAEVTMLREVNGQLSAENDRLRQRLLELHPGVTP